MCKSVTGINTSVMTGKYVYSLEVFFRKTICICMHSHACTCTHTHTHTNTHTKTHTVIFVPQTRSYLNVYHAFVNTSNT